MNTPCYVKNNACRYFNLAKTHLNGNPQMYPGRLESKQATQIVMQMRGQGGSQSYNFCSQYHVALATTITSKYIWPQHYSQVPSLMLPHWRPVELGSLAKPCTIRLLFPSSESHKHNAGKKREREGQDTFLLSQSLFAREF